MEADGARWVTALPETARFYAGVVRSEPRRNSGIVLELELPEALLRPGGSAFAQAVSLDAVPDEAVFATRIGLGHYRVERAADGGLDHGPLGNETLAELTWFSPKEVLEEGRVRLPDWTRTGCGRSLRRLSEGLPPINPLF